MRQLLLTSIRQYLLTSRLTNKKATKKTMAFLLVWLSMICFLVVAMPWNVRANNHEVNDRPSNLRRQARRISTQIRVCPDRITSCQGGAICVPSRRREAADIFRRDTNKERHIRYECVAPEEVPHNHNNGIAVSSESLPPPAELPLDMMDRLFVHDHETTTGNSSSSSSSSTTESANGNGTSVLLADDSTRSFLSSADVSAVEGHEDDHPDDDGILKAAGSIFIPAEDFLANDDENTNNQVNVNPTIIDPPSVAAWKIGSDPVIEQDNSSSDDSTNDSDGDKSAIYFLIVTFFLVLVEIGCLRWVELRVRHTREREQEELDPFRDSLLSATTPSMELDIGLAKAEAQVALVDEDDTEEESHNDDDLIRVL